ncbi:MAG: Hsp33 family molecular chaperone HslO [Thermodesulfobacteriota bacterium]
MDVLLKGIVRKEAILAVSLIDTETVEKARSIHDTYPTASAALGRVISGALLLASMLKEDQRLTLQVTGEGPLREIVAEVDWLLRVRGYVRRPHIHLGLKNGKLDVGRAIGKGLLHVIKDLGLAHPYRGTVPLQTGEIATDLAYYLATSEQIPSAVSLGVYVDTDNTVKASGGFMIQALPGAKDETIKFLENRLRQLPPISSMILGGMTLEDILKKAVGLPIDFTDRKEVLHSCPCSRERIIRAIVALGEKEIKDLIEKGKEIEIQCEFCKNLFIFSLEELHSILEDMR